MTHLLVLVKFVLEKNLILYPIDFKALYVSNDIDFVIMMQLSLSKYNDFLLIPYLTNLISWTTASILF